MFKKFLTVAFSLFFLLFVVACGGDTTLTTATTATTEPTTVTTQTTVTEVTLPDLTGMSKSQISTALDELGLNYIFEYQTTTAISEDVFVEYGGNDQIGDPVTDAHQIIVVLATPRLILPDLSGMNQSQIISALLAAGIDFHIEIVTDNTVPDQTFAGYGDNLEAGDLVPSSYEITVYLGYNQTVMPDLTGKMKGEIITILTDLNIQYEFSYVVDDNYPEDSFAGYVGIEAGEYYQDNIVTVNLYKNTFTDNPTSLIISKYVDGGDGTSDQAIELYNATDATIDLSQYFITIYVNGSKTANYHIALPQVNLASGETYVIANSDANANILVKADQTSADLLFDGNDVIQLCYMNGTYIDTIYNIGNRDFTLDNEVFIRAADVVRGTRTFTFSQWNGYIPTYTSVLGTHPIALSWEIPFQVIPRSFDDPLGGMDLVDCTGVADGDTAYFSPGFEGAERVRFLGVDTPETYPYVDPWGPEAKEYTTYIINHAISTYSFYIQSDPDLGYTDNYGRHLGLVWVDLGDQVLTIDILSSTGEVMRTETLTGWILLNYHLVLNGYSYNYYSSESTLVMGNRYVFRWFQDAERYAQQNGLGVHEE